MSGRGELTDRQLEILEALAEEAKMKASRAVEVFDLDEILADLRRLRRRNEMLRRAGLDADSP